MIRLILALLPALLFLILTLPLSFAIWLIQKWKPGAGDQLQLRMVQWIFKVMLWISGVKATVIGEENVPKDQAVLYIINHRSYFDILLTYSRCPRLTGYIAKKEIGRVPLLALWMRRLHCLFLDRKDIKEGLKTILAAIDYVKSGISIAIFPEGSRGRSADETELLPFHEGSFKIALKSGCPIIPVSINHSSAIMEDHMPWIKAAHVVLEYGAPIYPEQLSREEKKFLGKQVQAVIQDTLKKNQHMVVQKGN